ncbi:MAG TPA: class I SAM-dependent methyltransferase [Solirubrobacteraceae bacterium]|nr:class I SAM-dependent methyltransferase [Solirubrobacteraceae bacterium]
MDNAADAASHWQLEPAVCPICGDSRSDFVGYRGGWAHRRRAGVAVSVVRCATCGLLYPQPVPRPRDMSHYTHADEYFGFSDPEPHIAGHATTIADASRRLGKRGRMLDIGCGRGEALVAARRAGWDAVGFEPAGKFAAAGRKSFGVEIVCAAIEEAPPPAATFDLVLLSAVLEHVYEPLMLLRHAERALRPGGLVFIDVPNERSLLHLLATRYLRLRGRNWTFALSPTFPPYHVVGFSKRSLRYALGEAGLTPASIRTYPMRFGAHVAGRSATLASAFERAAQLAQLASGLVAWATKP